MRARLRGLPRDDAELDPGRFRLSRLVAVAGLERRERDLRPRRPIPAQSTAIVVSRGWQQRATSKSPKPAFATRPGTSTPRRWRSASRPNVNHASRRRPDFDQDSGMRLAAARFLSEEIRLTVRQAMRAAGAEGRYSPMILISTHLRRPPSNSP